MAEEDARYRSMAIKSHLGLFVSLFISWGGGGVSCGGNVVLCCIVLCWSARLSWPGVLMSLSEWSDPITVAGSGLLWFICIKNNNKVLIDPLERERESQEQYIYKRQSLVQHQHWSQPRRLSLSLASLVRTEKTTCYIASAVTSRHWTLSRDASWLTSSSGGGIVNWTHNKSGDQRGRTEFYLVTP